MSKEAEALFIEACTDWEWSSEVELTQAQQVCAPQSTPRHNKNDNNEFFFQEVQILAKTEKLQIKFAYSTVDIFVGTLHQL